MKTRFIFVLAASFASTCFSSAYARPIIAAGAGAQPSYVQDHDDHDRDRDRRDRDWRTPPNEFDEYARRGFQEGIEGARKDYGNRRRPDVNNRWEFRHPRGVPYEFREAYRRGFERGYRVGVEHIYNGR